MAEKVHLVPRRLRLPAAVAFVVFIGAIAYLGVTITREVEAFDRSQNETAQWSLTQTEVEILTLLTALRAEPIELRNVRLRFDVLYSRIQLLNRARVFEPLRQSADFTASLTALTAFLDEAVPIIDAPDAELLRRVPELDGMAFEARLAARQMALDGLALFGEKTDSHRAVIATRTSQLAITILALLLGLVLALAFLDRVNRRAAARGRALRRSSARINAIKETALDAIIVADDRFRIVDFGPAAETIFGLSFENALGREFFGFIGTAPAPGDQAARHAIIAEMLTHPGRVTREVYRADATTFPAEIAFEQAQVPAGVLYTIVVRDISDRVKAEQALTAARDAALANERLKSDFLAKMSHEIRTPLNGLLGNMDLLRRTVLPPAQSRYVENMDASGRILMRHVNDVLDITQYDSGKMSVTPRRTHLPALLDDMVATLDSLAQAQKTHVAWRWIGEPQAWVEVDPDRYAHILLNIIGNAIKFTVDGDVDIALEIVQDTAAPQLVTRIMDTGQGIAQELVPQIFDDFVTGDTVGERDSEGTGLGLGIAKRFAVALGGDLSVESRLGVGTTFTLEIPVVVLAAAPHHSAPAPLAPIESLSVLVVEDNEMNRLVVREMLQDDGHRVSEAVHGSDGVTQAQRKAFDVILMDIRMPVLDGIGATREIKAGGGASANAPIVAVTANALEADHPKYRAAGMVGTLTKPLTRHALRAVLREVATPVTHDAVALVDMAHLTETQATLGAGFDKMCGRFLAEVDAFLQADENTDDLAERAHKLAGSAALFGATRWVTALNGVEGAARAGELILLARQIATLPAIWDDTLAALGADPACATPPAAE